jgi:hypothetical protein
MSDILEVLRDDIEQIISNTHDIDARDHHYADNIIAHIESHYNITRKHNK